MIGNMNGKYDFTSPKTDEKQSADNSSYKLNIQEEEIKTTENCEVAPEEVELKDAKTSVLNDDTSLEKPAEHKRPVLKNHYIDFINVKKIYDMGEIKIEAVKNVAFHVNAGELCIIVGASGAGKTTVLNILGGMDTLTSGQIFLDGEEISNYSQKMLTEYRRHDVGFVFQFYNLIPNLTALENVELASEICKNPMDAKDILDSVGLNERLSNFPAQLSGGEQQRVSIARALAKNPKLLLCDEPTGALDYKTGKAILKVLQDMARKEHKTVLIITHNSALCDMADRVVRMNSGEVTEMYTNANPVPVEDIVW